MRGFIESVACTQPIHHSSCNVQPVTVQDLIHRAGTRAGWQASWWDGSSRGGPGGNPSPPSLDCRGDA